MKTYDEPIYGNWIPGKLLLGLWAAGTLLSVLFLLSLTLWKNTALQLISCLLTSLILGCALYMQTCHRAFSFQGGRLMQKIHWLVLDCLPWDGRGKLLDIGCGSGALSIRCARKYADASVVGVDCWGRTWEHGKARCEENARLAKVENTEFIQGDARALPFEDESFDAVVSNFVFLEVRSEKDKRLLVKEALRVVKKGGSFALHDMFDDRQLYGDIHLLLKELREAGVSRIYYQPSTEDLPFIPDFVRSPLMLHHLGMIYGIK